MPKLARVFPRRTSFTPTDELAFIGDPPLFLPELDEVHVSCTFTWDLPEARRLARAWSGAAPSVKLGGPALSQRSGPFIPGLYVKRGITFTSRGCPNHCPYCLAPHPLQPLDPIEPGHIIQDDNFLANRVDHRAAVYAMLGQQHRIEFPGGLDATRLTDWDVIQLRKLHIRQLFLSLDTLSATAPSLRAIRTLRRAGFSQRQIRVYVLAGYEPDDSPELAATRCRLVLKAGGTPFGMRYISPSGRREPPNTPWATWSRSWTRPALIFAKESLHA